MKGPSNHMRRLCAGFTLVELLVVISIMTIIMVIAIPNFLQWRKSIRSKEVAWDIVGMGRYGRQLAANNNLEFRLEFDIDGRRYRLTRGNVPFGSTVWVEEKPWENLNQFVNWSTGSACNGTADVNIEFNPNGTADAAVDTICISDLDNNLRYTLIVSLTVGMIRIE
ncbi:hypothetical protein MNBD_DELTA01-1675 [hydrothermal vent metagenome]|uniref:General secretion pathway GspH domain-containing protein n=1 Tax=hydrothermal vent metagenome TaxID=652676 RepID=A0A3B0R420_9ZZZZ